MEEVRPTEKSKLLATCLALWTHYRLKFFLLMFQEKSSLQAGTHFHVIWGKGSLSVWIKEKQ